MATVTKDFKVKNGLIVEGTTGTINNHDILTKKTDDQNYIIGLIGGSSDSANTPNTVVKRDGNGDFAAGTITADIVGTVSDISNHDTDDLSEGTSNKYFTEGRVRDAINPGTGLNFNRATGYIDANLGTGLETDGSNNIKINRTTVDTWYDASGSASTAQSNAEDYADSLASNYDPAGSAATAQGNAEDYADGLISTEVTNRNNAISDAIDTEVSDRNDAISTAITNLNLAGTYDALGAAADALSDANDYTDARETAITSAYQAYADQAESDAILSANAYADQKVADLVDAAPALLDTLNELAAAIGDDNDFIGTVTASIGEKVAKSGDTMTGDLVMSSNKVTSLGAPTANGDATNKFYVDTEVSSAQSAAESYTDTEISALDTLAQGYANTAQSNAESFATGAANTAQSNAEDYADGLASNYDAAGSASTAQTNANSYTDSRETAITSAYQSYADTAESDAISSANSYTDSAISGVNNTISALDTDDVAEGSNLYYTAARAKAEAATLLANATKTNIVITKDGSNNLTITAENGVADSDTDDLTEGTTNLYFTDARAVSALEAVTPQFQAVDITWATKNTATYTYVANASTATVMSWSNNYASAKFLVRVRSGNHSQVSEVLVTTDNSNNVAITEYAIVGTNGNLGNVSANFSAGEYNLTVETTENNSEVIVYATLMAYGD